MSLPNIVHSSTGSKCGTCREDYFQRCSSSECQGVFSGTRKYDLLKRTGTCEHELCNHEKEKATAARIPLIPKASASLSYAEIKLQRERTEALLYELDKGTQPKSMMKARQDIAKSNAEIKARGEEIEAMREWERSVSGWIPPEHK